MDIVGHGVDIADVAVIGKLSSGPKTDFIERCFSPRELARLDNCSNRAERLAGHFAAKEAVAKAIGTGFDGEVSPLDIEIAAEQSGKPAVLLHGYAARASKRLGISSWYLSIAHAGGIAIASAIATK